MDEHDDDHDLAAAPDSATAATSGGNPEPQTI